MINRLHVKGIIKKPKGQFEFDLGSAGSVSSGRSFEQTVLSVFDLA